MIDASLPSKKSDFSDRAALVAAFLAALPDKKFSWDTMVGVAPSLAVALAHFPSGAPDLYPAIEEYCCHGVASQREAIAGQQRVRDRVICGSMAFLGLFSSCPMALSVVMRHSPKRFLALLWAVADEIWHQAGDTSTDHNYYTKRFLLSKILSHAVLFLLGTGSFDEDALKAFLERDVSRVFAIMKPIASLKRAFSK